jgi:enolase
MFYRETPSSFVMPVPFFNVLNGGVHSGNEMAFQEFMLAPIGASSFREAVQIGCECYQQLKQIIVKKFGANGMALWVVANFKAGGIGDEGGFAPPISRPQQALDLLTQAVKEAGYEGKVAFAIDPASQEFLNSSGKYDLDIKATSREHETLTPSKLSELYRGLLSSYPIVLLEDPFGQDDWQSWVEFASSSEVELVGDDLLATNIERVKIAAEKKACNSMLLKINQIGTITEALDA